jgi:hypothetical protein
LHSAWKAYGDRFLRAQMRQPDRECIGGISAWRFR